MLYPKHPAFIFVIVMIGAMAIYPFHAQSACNESTGRTERQSYRSTIATTTMHYTVYLPPCYDANADTPYPTIYLLHGSASYDDHWLQLDLDTILDEGIANGVYPPLIAVLPYGEWIANENQFDRVSFENVFLEELMPAVETTYRISTERDTRAIGGISRGGFWAFGVAFRHPNLFSSVGGHSAFFDSYHAPPEHNPLDLALHAPDIETLRIALDRGADDYAYAGLDQMDANLAERGVDYTYTVHSEGEHDNRYWRAHVAEYLAFYTEPWQTPSTPDIPDPATFTFTPPQQPDPDMFVFNPPQANTSTLDAINPVMLFVPVVAFNSTQSNIDSGTLWNLLAGMPDDNFLLDPETYSLLVEHGVSVNASRFRTRDEIETALWRNRNQYTLLPFDALTPRYRVLHVDGSNPILNLENYPLALASDTPNYDPERLTTLTLSGVTAITRDSIAPIDRNGVEWAASGIADFTNRVDFFHTSNEVSFTPNCPQTTETPLGAFCSKTAHFAILELLGLDIVELSGNHNNDYGYRAYLDTLAMYRDRGIYTIGGGATVDEARTPLVIEHNGSRIGMLACNDVGPYYAIVGADRPGATDCNRAWLEPTLGNLRDEVDIIVVTVQHTEFEEYLPRQEIQFDFRQIADWGADVVVGTHAHKPQSFEFYATRRGDRAFLHYGLGNLFFDQDFWGNSRFWMDTLFVYDGKLIVVDLFTGIIDDQARPRPMTTEEQQNWLDFMFLVNNGVQ